MTVTWYDHTDWHEVVIDVPEEKRSVRITDDPEGMTLAVILEEGYPCYTSVNLSPNERSALVQYFNGMLVPTKDAEESVPSM